MNSILVRTLLIVLISLGAVGSANAQLADQTERKVGEQFLERLEFMRAGGNVGGGGDVYVQQFVSLAEAILARVKFEPQHRAILNQALATTQILTVDILRDPTSGEPIAYQGQIPSWGSPGLIQLKMWSFGPDDMTWSRLVKEQGQIAQYIVHELFRSSGIVNSKGLSIDDTFQLTIGRYHLDQLGTQQPAVVEQIAPPPPSPVATDVVTFSIKFSQKDVIAQGPKLTVRYYYPEVDGYYLYFEPGSPTADLFCQSVANQNGVRSMRSLTQEKGERLFGTSRGIRVNRSGSENVYFLEKLGVPASRTNYVYSVTCMEL